MRHIQQTVSDNEALRREENRPQIDLEDLIQAAAQLGTRELEHLVAKVLALRAQRLAPSLAKEEARLLGTINQGLPAEDQRRYGKLTSKLEAELLSPEEHRELLTLIDRIEHTDAERVRALTDLAQLRAVPVETLMRDLGIHPPAHG